MSQTDIVERLRESGSQDCMRGEPWRSQVKDEAADTITQLRLSNERMRQKLTTIGEGHWGESVGRYAKAALTAESAAEGKG